MPIAATTRRRLLALIAGTSGLIRIRGASATVQTSTRSAPANSAEPSAPQPVDRRVPRTPFEFGAKGDGAHDDGPALREAVASCGRQGGVLWLASAQYRAGAQDGQVLRISAPIALSGASPAISIINPLLAGDTDDIIVISPAVDVGHEGLVLRDFGLLDPVNGSRKGRRAILLDTGTPGQQLAGCWLENLSVGAGTGSDALAVHHRNGSGSLLVPNVNGGWYGGGIRRCLIRGGIFLENSGDSLHVDENIVAGAGRALTVALISGASCLTVHGNNMTTAGGAIKHVSGSRCAYTNNNIEHHSPGIETDSDGHRSVVEFAGGHGPNVANRLTGGLVSCFGTSDANVLVKIKNQIGFVLDDVTLLVGARGVTAVYIDASSRDTVIGRLIAQDLDGNGTADLSIIDHGVGTIGVTKSLALCCAGVAGRERTAALRFRKGVDGWVRLWGSFAAGPFNANSIIAVLPPGFRPSTQISSSLTSVAENGDRLDAGSVAIQPSGEVKIAGVRAGANYLVVEVCFDELGNNVVSSPE